MNHLRFVLVKFPEKIKVGSTSRVHDSLQKGTWHPWSSYLLGVKCVVWYHLGCLNLKWPPLEAFRYLLGFWSRKKYAMQLIAVVVWSDIWYRSNLLTDSHCMHCRLPSCFLQQHYFRHRLDGCTLENQDELMNLVRQGLSYLKKITKYNIDTSGPLSRLLWSVSDIISEIVFIFLYIAEYMLIYSW